MSESERENKFFSFVAVTLSPQINKIIHFKSFSFTQKIMYQIFDVKEIRNKSNVPVIQLTGFFFLLPLRFHLHGYGFGLVSKLYATSMIARNVINVCVYVTFIPFHFQFAFHINRYDFFFPKISFFLFTLRLLQCFLECVGTKHANIS